MWKYGEEEIEKWIWEFCNSVWKGKGWPKEWKKGVIIPIVKKDEGEKVEKYRGMTLLPTAYKVYISMLAEKLKEEIEMKRMIPHNQTGFRQGMGRMDNIYTINYLINRQIGRKGRKMVAMFLKAAFDSVDRDSFV